MSLPARQQWMSDMIAQSFGLEPDEVKAYVTKNKASVDQFLTDLESHPRLFFFHQPRKAGSPKRELSMTLGPEEKLTSKCVYFLRESQKPVKQTAASDDSVVCGELNPNILQVYESTLSQVYRPMLEHQAAWGEISEDKERRPFLKETSKFVSNLQRKIDNLRGDVELETPHSPFDTVEQKPSAYSKAAEDPLCLKHFHSIVESWISTISKYISNDPSVVPLNRNDLSGPDVEIEYWSRRKLTLISITEQLKARANRTVTGVLRARAQRDDDEVEIGRAHV